MFDMPSRLRWLRWTIVAEILLLAIQYEIGTSLSIAGVFPAVPASAPSFGVFGSYVGTAGGSLAVHAVLGVLILADAVVTLVLARATHVPWLRITAAVEFVFVLSAGLGGFFFVLSGFADDSSSYQMSTGFLLAFVFTFLFLYVLRNPDARVPSASAS